MFSFVYRAASSASSYVKSSSHYTEPSSSQMSGELSTVHPFPYAHSDPFHHAHEIPSSSSSSSTSSSWDDSSEASSSSSSTSPSSTPLSSLGSPPGSSSRSKVPNAADKYAIIESVLRHEDLYEVLGTTKDANVQTLRRAYITRSKRCHPDKFPEYPLATLAFQKVSFAYDTLSQPSSRRSYDRNKAHFPYPYATPTSSSNNAAQSSTASSRAASADDTLNAVLYGVFCDFMDGDVEMIRTFLRAMGEINAKMSMGDETIEGLLNSLMRLREVLLVGQKYIRIVRFELIRMYEIQHNLRALPYLDVRGRLRLTFQLARVTLNLPVVVDLAMREGQQADEDEYSDEDFEDMNPASIPRPKSRAGSTSSRRRRRSTASTADGLGLGLDNGNDGRERPRVKLGKVKGRTKRGLIPPPVKVVIGLAIGALEMGERVL
ncbi:hypothetical protein FRB94_000208 [Tulasnella sp. JGI-2019a]|nr:hypothetical protein FRB94_000208 [Tulasnella sp. JGI-2019a]KAG9039361.1 hypothetical protein FRB95_010649 [Tulasnella sp. JGI-2019a]